jgi:hypothetical protein
MPLRGTCHARRQSGRFVRAKLHPPLDSARDVRTKMITGLPSASAFASLLLCVLLPLQLGCTSKAVAPSTLDGIQGRWEGYLNGDEASAKCTITIAGESLRFYRDANFWFDTTFTLDEGKQPKQMHVTIRKCAPPEDSIGEEMHVILKLENQILTLAGEQSSGVDAPAEFPVPPIPGSAFRYDLRKLTTGG